MRRFQETGIAAIMLLGVLWCYAMWGAAVWPSVLAQDAPDTPGGVSGAITPSRGRALWLIHEPDYSRLTAEIADVVSAAAQDGWSILVSPVPPSWTQEQIRQTVLTWDAESPLQGRAVIILGQIKSDITHGIPQQYHDGGGPRAVRNYYRYLDPIDWPRASAPYSDRYSKPYIGRSVAGLGVVRFFGLQYKTVDGVRVNDREWEVASYRRFLARVASWHRGLLPHSSRTVEVSAGPTDAYYNSALTTLKAASTVTPTQSTWQAATDQTYRMAYAVPHAPRPDALRARALWLFSYVSFESNSFDNREPASPNRQGWMPRRVLATQKDLLYYAWSTQGSATVKAATAIRNGEPACEVWRPNQLETGIVMTPEQMPQGWPLVRVR